MENSSGKDQNRDYARIIGQKMKEYRERNGLRLFQMGQKLLVSETAVWKYENGERVPGLDVMIRFAELLGCSLDELISTPGEETDEMKRRFLAGVWELAEELLIDSHDGK